MDRSFLVRRTGITKHVLNCYEEPLLKGLIPALHFCGARKSESDVTFPCKASDPMICTVPAQNFRRPDVDFFQLRVELVAVDDTAVQVLGALDPSVLDGFHVHHTAGAADFHVSVLVAADAEQAARTATTLVNERALVFSIILANTAPETFSGSYLVCPAHSQDLLPLLVSLRRLCFEYSIIGIDFADFSPVFRVPGRICFFHRQLPNGTSLTEAGTDLGQRIRAQDASTSTVLMILAAGTHFRDPMMSETSDLHQIDTAINAVVQPFPDESLHSIVFAGYVLKDIDVFSLGVFSA